MYSYGKIYKNSLQEVKLNKSLFIYVCQNFWNEVNLCFPVINFSSYFFLFFTNVYTADILIIY